tara:strand:- start:2616 stop:3539 length:924 start_codon:yes stop_codon:yes gene_type:complete
MNKLILGLFLLLVVSGCTQEPDQTSNETIPGGQGVPTPETSPDSSDTVTTPDTSINQPPETQVPQDSAPDDAVAVMPQTIITIEGGTARLVSTISATNGGTISFKGKPDDLPNADKNNSKDTNSDKGKPDSDQNKTTGKPEKYDLNSMTALNITVGEISIHLSRSFVKTNDTNGSDDEIPDTNDTIPDTNTTVPDTNTTIPDINNSTDDTNSFDGNANFAQDENATKKQNKWIVISDEERIFNLLELATTESILSDVEIPAGQYTQIRLQIISAEVIIDGNSFDVRIPPNKLMLHGVFEAGNDEQVF